MIDIAIDSLGNKPATEISFFNASIKTPHIKPKNFLHSMSSVKTNKHYFQRLEYNEICILFLPSPSGSLHWTWYVYRFSINPRYWVCICPVLFKFFWVICMMMFVYDWIYYYVQENQWRVLWWLHVHVKRVPTSVLWSLIARLHRAATAFAISK